MLRRIRDASYKLKLRVLLAERVCEMLGARYWPRLALIIDEGVFGVD